MKIEQNKGTKRGQMFRNEYRFFCINFLIFALVLSVNEYWLHLVRSAVGNKHSYRYTYFPAWSHYSLFLFIISPLSLYFYFYKQKLAEYTKLFAVHLFNTHPFIMSFNSRSFFFFVQTQTFHVYINATVLKLLLILTNTHIKKKLKTD